MRRVRSPARWRNRSALTRPSSCRTCLHSSATPPVVDPLPCPCGPALPLLPAAPPRPPGQLVESCRTCLHSPATPPVADPLPCPCGPALPLLPAAPPRPPGQLVDSSPAGLSCLATLPSAFPPTEPTPRHMPSAYPTPYDPSSRPSERKPWVPIVGPSRCPFSLPGILFPRPRIGPFRGETRTAVFIPPAGRRSGPARTPGVSGSRPDRRALAGDRSPRGAGRAATRASASFPPA